MPGRTSLDVLIVSFNTKERLRDTLQSLDAHPPKSSIKLRVTVLDNASSDGSAAMVASEFPHVDLVTADSNLGFAAANNALARQTSGDYVMLLNSDVVLTSDITTPLLGAMEADPRAEVVAPRLVYPDGRVQYSAHKLPTLRYEFARLIRGRRLGRLLRRVFDSQALIDEVHEVALTDLRVNRSAEFVWATCWMLRRSSLNGGEIFDTTFPMYDEDLDFCRRALGRGGELRYRADVELVHVGGASSGSDAAKERLTALARQVYYRRHRGSLAGSAFALMVSVTSWLVDLIDRVPNPRRRAKPDTTALRPRSPHPRGPAGTTIFAVGPASGGVGDVFDAVSAQLSNRGYRIHTEHIPQVYSGAALGIRSAIGARSQLRAADHVHVEFGSNDPAVFWFGLVAAILRSDCVVVAHDFPCLINDPVAKLFPSTSRLVRALAYRLLSPALDGAIKRLLLRRAGTVAVFGPEAKVEWLARGACHVVVITHGADPPTPGLRPPSEGRHVLCAGFLGPGKGIDTLLDAWALVEDRVGLPLVLLGMPIEPWFSETIKAINFDSNPPQLLGPVADEREFQSHIDTAAIVVLPYRHSNPASGVLIRALTAGRAVIATPVPAMRAIRRDHNGLIVPIGDAQALARAIAHLCESPAERDRLGAAAAEGGRQEFTWDHHVDGLEAAYEAALTARAAR